MYELDKKKFGAFVAALRREKGYTQKELAQSLFISDKAVSKWETAVSIPDTALLIPLSELLGVTVTELLMCERMETGNAMQTEQVEDVVKAALSYSGEREMRAFRGKNQWGVPYICAVLLGGLGMFFGCWNQHPMETATAAFFLGSIFGAYFCFFVKTMLPKFYDQNQCNLYCDGVLRMNMPGISFHNSNWSHIVRTGRLWSLFTTGLYPLLNSALYLALGSAWEKISLSVFLVLVLGGLFVPMYIVEKKQE